MTLSIGKSLIRSTVRNAAKFAVYEEMIINVKNHQMTPTIRVDVAYDDSITLKISSFEVFNYVDLLEDLGQIDEAEKCPLQTRSCSITRTDSPQCH